MSMLAGDLLSMYGGGVDMYTCCSPPGKAKRQYLYCPFAPEIRHIYPEITSFL